MKTAAVLGAVAMVSIGAIRTASAEEGPVFFQDINYGGAATAPIAVGSHTLTDLQSHYDFRNDWESSVYIPLGCAVDLYSDDNFTGSHWMLDRNDFNSTDFRNFGGNDVVSSVRVRCGVVVFYRDINYQGPSAEIPLGCYSLSQLGNFGFLNDWASSVAIPDGLAVDLYSDDYFRGSHWMLDQRDSNSADFRNFGANDLVSSVCVSVR
jgi:hypothetical protein